MYRSNSYLLANVNIHPVFHVSQLCKADGSTIVSTVDFEVLMQWEGVSTKMLRGNWMADN